MKVLKKRLITILIIAVALFFLNPKISTHQKKIAEKIKEQNPIVGSFFGTELSKYAITYDNYYFFSITRISITKDAVSFGIGGFVIVFANLDIIKQIEDKINT